MPNVYFIPTLPVIFYWLKTGFVNSRCVDISYTDFNEQKTPWVNTESLEDFLDPQDRSKTVEGYPVPVRAIIISEKGDNNEFEIQEHTSKNTEKVIPGTVFSKMIIEMDETTVMDHELNLRRWTY